jgi:NTP pyrophosphatase (non-canonical NTP hydrolase)
MGVLNANCRRLNKRRVRGNMRRMETKSDLNELSQLVKSFCDDRDWDQFHSPKDVAIGLVTESAELLDLFRFKSEVEVTALLTDPPSREKVSDELADVFYWVLRFSQMQGFDLGDCLRGKMKKNSAKYPVEKSRGNNMKYTEFK